MCAWSGHRDVPVINPLPAVAALRPAEWTISLRYHVCSIRMSQSLRTAGSPAVPEEIWLFAGLLGDRHLVLLLWKEHGYRRLCRNYCHVHASSDTPPTQAVPFRLLSWPSLNFSMAAKKKRSPVHLLLIYLGRAYCRNRSLFRGSRRVRIHERAAVTAEKLSL